MFLFPGIESSELDNTINQLTESSISLAEAAANFGALKVIFGIFLVFMFIIMVAFFWQLFSTQKKVEDIHVSSKKVEKYMEETANRSLGKSQANIMIRRAFSSLSQIIKYTILRIRLENHIDQREATISKVSRLVNYEYAELASFLANFECGDIDLSDSIRLEDTQLIVDFMVEQIYKEPEGFSVSSMDQATDILLNGLKLEALKNFK